MKKDLILHNFNVVTFIKRKYENHFIYEYKLIPYLLDIFKKKLKIKNHLKMEYIIFEVMFQIF